MRKGSITLYLCLILGVLLSLICAGLFSARRAAGRVVLASAAEQGMYSLFSEYDRTLFDEFGILAIDGGYNNPRLKLGSLQDEAEDVVKFLTGSSGEIDGPSNLTKLSVERGEVTGYTLLTDGNGALFREQLLRALAGKKTVSAIQKIRDQFGSQSDIWRQLESFGVGIDADEIEQQYSDLQKPAETDGETMSYRGWNTDDPADAVLCDEVNRPETLPAAGENPIELIRGLKKLGIINLVLPKGRTVSQGRIEDDCVSRRSLQQGMGIIPEGQASFGDKVLLTEFLVDSFTDFTDAGETPSAGLQYQVEYAIGKRSTDAENLKYVLNRLLAIREISNYLYLMKDSGKQEEIHAAAAGISALIGFPVAEPVVAEMLRFCWSFGESVLDLRELLKGGKIPLLKDASSWQLSLGMLAHIQEELSEEHSSEKGLDYKWYLRMLLAAENDDTLTGMLMDLVEHKVRTTDGREGFRLDNCLVSMKIRFRAKQDAFFPMEAERSYNYVQ